MLDSLGFNSARASTTAPRVARGHRNKQQKPLLQADWFGACATDGHQPPGPTWEAMSGLGACAGIK
jgi:hypothetical protein